MPDKYITHNHSDDEIDRRGFLKCMAWAGTGMLWAASGGLVASRVLRAATSEALTPGADFTFVQISDSHIGFNKEANKDVLGTLRQAVTKINALPAPPDFILHTGDLSHLSEPEEFDTLEQILKECRTGRIFYVPGEHDVLNDNGKQYLERFGVGAKGNGWLSFDHKGTHFVGLNNVLQIREGGLGLIGQDQLAWMEDDLKAISDSTPVVVFAHVPLWQVYPQWGWGTEDGARALGLLKRFGSVTVLNGHIHQVMKKTEGNATFHTAMSTAFPQPAPGTFAPSATAQNKASPSPKLDPLLVATGHKLFLMNCAHCHADDATGDEGPDLHGLRKPDERLRLLIKNGIKGEMPRFGEKLAEHDVTALVAFLDSMR